MINSYLMTIRNKRKEIIDSNSIESECFLDKLGTYYKPIKSDARDQYLKSLDDQRVKSLERELSNKAENRSLIKELKSHSGWMERLGFGLKRVPNPIISPPQTSIGLNFSQSSRYFDTSSSQIQKNQDREANIELDRRNQRRKQNSETQEWLKAQINEK